MTDLDEDPVRCILCIIVYNYVKCNCLYLHFYSPLYRYRDHYYFLILTPLEDHCIVKLIQQKKN